jgi:predicted MFS family arabinose efflux permease
MVPNLLPPENVPSAIAFDSAVFNIARFLGPLIAGLIIQRWGVAPAFMFNAATFIIYLFALYRLRLLRSEVSDRSAGSLLSDTREGVRYAVNHPGIRTILLLLAAMAVSVKAVLDLLPGFADAVFHRGAGGLAELTAAAGLGAFIGAMYLAQRGNTKGLTLLTVSSLLIGGGGVLLLCGTDIYWLALIAMFFAGLSVTLSGTGAQVLMQGVVDGAMRGRVMSFYGVIYRGGPALGALVMGSASDLIGLQAAVAGGGVVLLLVWLWAIRGHRVTAEALEHVRG